ncbi:MULTISPECIES: hypothetical protein [Halomicrobium]|uniref:Uncharacterized protein n=2 Tax=Halomicrobium mukohataei TaxID=57705 RepID=C7P208_HALMD|nr:MULTISPECIES: hypothetical protein [Halomicrobium]ACV47237.1 hypothetical protein Hmuk_1110 [Halomicrobium mukohataei DSM 12286]QCD65710.1 hypothetical protein E5139_08730 [Halomicrobium mukohataei]QFR20516.1 hypothetical protein GBQ70_08725 [Halomicrobium sp. ZPS1]
MPEENKISRRKALKSLGTASLTTVSAGTVTAQEVSENLSGMDVVELSGWEKWEAIQRARTGREWRKIWREMVVDSAEGGKRSVTMQSASATRVTEENGEERVVVSAVYEDTDETEKFILDNGIDQLDTYPEEVNENEPTVAGYNIVSTGSTLQSERYYVDGDIVKTDSTSINTLRTQGVGNEVWYDPPEGECDTCRIETGVNCSPSRECLGRITSIAATGVGCSGCKLVPSWYNPACYACVLALIAQGLLGNVDCLGCKDTVNACIKEEYAEDLCG